MTTASPLRSGSGDHPGYPSQPISRRRFIRASAVLALGGAAGTSALLSACQPQTPAPSAGATPPTGGASAPTPNAAKPSAAKPGDRAASVFPTYTAFSGGAKPDYHLDDPLYSDAYDAYPTTAFNASTEAPGTGSTVNVLMASYFPTPTLYDQNPTWQEINRRLNANVQMNLVPGADYRVKFATTIAGDDLPDIMHIFFGYTVAPNLPAFFKAKCADLAPYLSGDAAKEYPYLAAIPTYAWKNSISAIGDQLFLLPIQRQMTSIPPFGGNFFKNVDFYDAELGADYTPKNADDFKRAMTQLNRPNESRSAIGNFGTNDRLFGLSGYTQMFGVPNNWQLDASGKLTKDRETEAYKAAVGYVRDLMAAGLFTPDAATMVNSRTDWVAKKFVVTVEGHGNSWVDAWQRGLQQNPPTRTGLIKPFAANDGQKPIAYLSQGFVSMNVLKKAPPDRIKELLRILNFLASPFGSQESTLLKYGIQGQDYTLDEKGTPQPTPEGRSRSGYVPWRYLAEHPWVHSEPALPGYAKAAHEAEQAVIPLGIDDPTNGFYAPTLYGKGAVADVAFNDGVRDIILGRKPLSALDGFVKDWQRDAGEQIRKEYLDAMAAAK
jgi:putative aldouronate transport system substrate-binding protein